MNVPTLLTTIRLLMAHPNGDDGLMPDIVSFVCLDYIERMAFVSLREAAGLRCDTRYKP